MSTVDFGDWFFTRNGKLMGICESILLRMVWDRPVPCSWWLWVGTETFKLPSMIAKVFWIASQRESIMKLIGLIKCSDWSFNQVKTVRKPMKSSLLPGNEVLIESPFTLRISFGWSEAILQGLGICNSNWSRTEQTANSLIMPIFSNKISYWI